MNTLTAIVFAGLVAACLCEDQPSYSDQQNQYPEPPAYSDPYSDHSGYGSSYQQPPNPYPQPPPNYYGQQPPVNNYPQPSSYGQYPPQPANNYYGYNYYQPDPRYVESLLDRLVSHIENVELQEVYHRQKLGRVIEEANRNLDFKLYYENTLAQEFESRQKEQNARLDALEMRVAEIMALRNKVAALQADAEAIADEIEADYAERKQDIYDINDLRNSDIDRIARIEETKGRADAVNDRIDALFEKAWDNTRDIEVVNRNTKRAILATNQQMSILDGQYTLYPTKKTQIFTAEYDQPVDGIPEAYQFPVVGFHFQKKHYKSYDDPELHFETSVEVWDQKADISYVEMSAGGWSTERLIIDSGMILYADKIEFIK